MVLLEISNLTLVKDGKTIIDGLSLQLEQGGCYAVVGLNGAGKSSLAYTLMGLQDYTENGGDILLAGQSLRGMSVTQRAVAGMSLAWQDPAEFEGISVRQYLLAACPSHDTVMVSSALERVGLMPDQYLDRLVDRQLSGGERKRIELAALLTQRPKLAILDEPDSGIDLDAIKNIFGCIAYLQEQGTTVLLITHSPQMLQHARKAFLLHRGKLQASGSPQTILVQLQRTLPVAEAIPA